MRLTPRNQTPPHLRQFPAAVGGCRPWSTHLSDIDKQNRVRSVFLRKTDLTPMALPADRGNLSKAGWVRWQGCPRHGCRGQAPKDGFTASPATGPTPPTHSKPAFAPAVVVAVASAGAGRSPAAPANPYCNRERSIQAYFSWVCSRWVIRSSVGASSPWPPPPALHVPYGIPLRWRPPTGVPFHASPHCRSGPVPRRSRSAQRIPGRSPGH